MKNTVSNQKVYVRSIDGGHGEQILFVHATDNSFTGIENVDNGVLRLGYCPNDYETGSKVPRGFFKRHGFKRKNITLEDEMYLDVVHGDKTN